MNIGKNVFLRSLRERNGEELLKLLRGLGGEWVVSSTIFGCALGHSKIFLRRRRGKSGGITCNYCFGNEEAKKIKSEIKELLRKL